MQPVNPDSFKLLLHAKHSVRFKNTLYSRKQKEGKMRFSEKFYEMKRLEQIASCLFKHELHYLIDLLKIKMHLPLHKQLALKKTLISETHPAVLREIFEELGGAFLKLGQVISLRPDLVGIELSKEFEKVLDEVPPESFRTVVEVINKNLPHGMKTFREFNSHPIASGSIAQVHAAVLDDGRKVAVKIQRPHIREIFIRDIAIMRTLAERLKENPHFEFFDPVEVVDEFKKYTLRELDFNHEAVNMIRFRKNLAGCSTILIPKVYKEFSNDKVLVMERANGEDIFRIKDKLKNNEKRFVVETISKMIIKQIFEDGFFHADLHPGNIMYLKKGKIAILDYGIVGYLDKELKEDLYELFIGLINGDLIKVTDSLIEINVGDKDIDREALKSGLHYSLSDFYDTSMEKLPVGEVFKNMIDTAARSQLRLPSNFVLLGKSLFTVEGFCRELSPDFNIVRYAKPTLKHLAKKEFSPNKLAKDAINTAVGLKKLVVNAPRYVEDFTHKIDLIEDRVTKYEAILKDYHEWMIRIAQSVIYSILLIPILITSSILMGKEPLWFGISAYSFIGYGISLLLMLAILRAINKKTRR